MVKFMRKKDVIMYKEQGMSNREVAMRTGLDRATVSKYWNEYRDQLSRLDEFGSDAKAIQESLMAEPKYSATNRKRRKYTEELDERLRAILKEEERKDRLFGPGHKQKLTNRQIHKKLVEESYSISTGTIYAALATMRKKHREVFIRQQYELGERLEYDFGEVLLDCGEGVKSKRGRCLDRKAGYQGVNTSPGGTGQSIIFRGMAGASRKK